MDNKKEKQNINLSLIDSINDTIKNLGSKIDSLFEKVGMIGDIEKEVRDIIAKVKKYSKIAFWTVVSVCGLSIILQLANLIVTICK